MMEDGPFNTMLVVIALLVIALMFLAARSADTRSEYIKWCMTKAETKEQVLVCHNGKFPWEK